MSRPTPWPTAPLPSPRVPVGSLRFGPWELWPDQRRLLYMGDAVALGGRAFDLLCCLARRRPAVVSQAELLDAAWPGEAVDPNNLQVQIHALRRLLGRQAIVTVPRRGYRLVPERTIRPDAGQLDLPTAAPLAECLHQHPVLTLVGAADEVLMRHASRAARRYADSAGVGLWIVDGPALHPSPALLDDSCPLAPLLHRVSGRADLVLLLQAQRGAPGLLPRVRAARAAAPMLRWLLTAAEPLGLEDERVVNLTAHPGPQTPPAGPPLRWRTR